MPLFSRRVKHLLFFARVVRQVISPAQPITKNLARDIPRAAINERFRLTRSQRRRHAFTEALPSPLAPG